MATAAERSKTTEPRPTQPGTEDEDVDFQKYERWRRRSEIEKDSSLATRREAGLYCYAGAPRAYDASLFRSSFSEGAPIPGSGDPYAGGYGDFFFRSGDVIRVSEGDRKPPAGWRKLADEEAANEVPLQDLGVLSNGVFRRNEARRLVGAKDAEIAAAADRVAAIEREIAQLREERADLATQEQGREADLDALLPEITGELRARSLKKAATLRTDHSRDAASAAWSERTLRPQPTGPSTWMFALQEIPSYGAKASDLFQLENRFIDELVKRKIARVATPEEAKRGAAQNR